MRLDERLPRTDRVAIDDGRRTWTYAQLHDEADTWVDRLARQGIGQGAAFGWLGPNSVAMLAALFACARLHARFVPLNWRLATPELRAIAVHAGLAAWHADPGFDALDGFAPQPFAPDTLHDDLLLVYTSGTTGEPKGALHTQAAICANLDAAIDAQGFGDGTRTLAVLPLFHVGGLSIQVLPTLAAGGTLKLQPRFDAGAWFDDVAAWRPTTSLLVPATMRALVEHPRWAGADLSSLAFVNSAPILPHPGVSALAAAAFPPGSIAGGGFASRK